MDKFAIMSYFYDKHDQSHQYMTIATSKEQALNKLQVLINKHGKWASQSHLLLTSFDEILDFEFPSHNYLLHDEANRCCHVISLSIDYEKEDWEDQYSKEEEKYETMKWIAKNIKVPKNDRNELGGES